jgi:type IV pilus assembly protein PilE
MLPKNKKPNGFTLIEVMITLVIIAIISAIAFPLYTGHVTKTRRSDATIGLTTLANAQERFYQDCNSYTTFIGVATAAVGTCATANSGLGYTSALTKDGYYTLSVAAATTVAYDLRATPVGGSLQAGDGGLGLTSTGAKWYDLDKDGTQDINEMKWKW